MALTKEQRRDLYLKIVRLIEEAVNEVSDFHEIRVGVSDADPATHPSGIITDDVLLSAKFYGHNEPDEDGMRRNVNPTSSRPKAKGKRGGNAKPSELLYQGRDGELYRHNFGKKARLVGVPGGVQIKGVRVVNGQIVG